MALELVIVRPKRRAPIESCFLAVFAGLRSKAVRRTEIIGATLAMVNIPKPSGEFTAILNPIPIERTNGTVTGLQREVEKNENIRFHQKHNFKNTQLKIFDKKTIVRIILKISFLTLL